MAIDFSKFDKMVDIEGLKHDIETAKEKGSGEYAEVPLGTYEVKIDKMELGETGENSKNPGSPMVKVQFRILNGEFENSCLFMNQVITQGFQIHVVNEFLRSLESGLEIGFETYSQYNDLLMDVMEKIDGSKEYAIEYGEKKGFKTFKIVEVFDLEDDSE